MKRAYVAVGAVLLILVGWRAIDHRSSMPAPISRGAGSAVEPPAPPEAITTELELEARRTSVICEAVDPDADDARSPAAAVSTLSGRVHDAASLPVPGIAVQLQSLGGEHNYVARSEPDGTFLLEATSDGPHVLHVSAPEFLDWQEHVELTLGGTTARDIELRSRPPGGRIAGTVRSATGRFDGRVFLFLSGLGEQDYWDRRDVVWEDGADGRLGRFDFGELGFGTYTLTCNSIDAVPIDHRARSVIAPSPDVEFLVRDDAPTYDLAFRVVAAGTGEVIDQYTFLFQVDGGYIDAAQVAPESPLSRTVAEGVEFSWRILAPGYQSASGRNTDFADRRPILARVEPGFSAVVRVSSIESLRHPAGVELFADGRSIGVTDESGRYFLDLPAQPETLGVDQRFWRVHSDESFVSDIDPVTGAFEGPVDGYFIGAYLRTVK